MLLSSTQAAYELDIKNIGQAVITFWMQVEVPWSVVHAMLMQYKSSGCRYL
jgi:hypothetical protein